MRVELPQDMADVEAGGNFELIPPGTYSLEVDNIEIKTGKTSGEPYMNLTYKIVDDEDYAGRVIFDIITLKATALWKLKQFSLATGIDIACEFDTEDFFKAEFDAVIDVEKGGLKGEDSDGEEVFYPDKNTIKSFVFSE
jgi:hypothetical protein